MNKGDNHRLAALRLHGLADSDRRWLLSRVAGTDRIKLEGYLEELKGFQLDPETLEELEARVTSVATSSGSDSASRVLAAHAAEQVLAAEPQWLSRVLRPDGSDHRIGDAVTSLTPRARAFIENTYKEKVSSLSAKHPAGREPVKRVANTHVRSASMWTRLREAWPL